MKLSQLIKNSADLEIGDEILMGKFRNVPAVVTGFGTGTHGQPTIKTTKGEKPLYRFRIKKLLPKSEQK
jgi:hypothetical protein